MFKLQVADKAKTQIVYPVTFFENRAVSDTMWKQFAEPDKPQMTLRRMRFACWISKAADTHSEYAILTSCPLQQWFQENASMLRIYVPCLFC